VTSLSGTRYSFSEDSSRRLLQFDGIRLVAAFAALAHALLLVRVQASEVPLTAVLISSNSLPLTETGPARLKEQVRITGGNQCRASQWPDQCRRHQKRSPSIGNSPGRAGMDSISICPEETPIKIRWPQSGKGSGAFNAIWFPSL